MDRRSFLKSTGAAAAATATGVALEAAPGMAAPSLPTGAIELRLATALATDLPGVDGFVRRLGERMVAMSGGRLRLAPAAGTAADPAALVAAGEAEIGLTMTLAGNGRPRAEAFFTGVPYGLTGEQTATWLACGGGQSLWDALAAEQGLKPFHAGHGGLDRGLYGVRPLAGLKSVSIAACGVAGDVLAALGAAVQRIAPDNLVPSLASGRLDAAMGFDPMLDLMLGMPSAAASLQHGDFFAGGTHFSAVVGRAAWDRLSSSDRAILEVAIESASLALTRELAAHSRPALAAMRARGMMIAHETMGLWLSARQATADLLADVAAEDRTAARIAASHRGFQQMALSDYPKMPPEWLAGV